MASGRWLSHTLFPGWGGGCLGPSPVLSLTPPSNPCVGLSGPSASPVASLSARLSRLMQR